MKNIVKYILSFLSRIYLHVTKNKIRVLAFHKVEKTEMFDRKLAHLKKTYNLISIEELHNHIFNNHPLPQKALLITFDDGDRTMLTNAYPLFKKHEIPAVLFIITSLIDTDQPFWWDEISYYVPGKSGLDMRSKAKKVPNAERIQMLADVRNGSQKEPFLQKQLTGSELHILHQAGMRIANHSHTHLMFDKTEKDELAREMKLSCHFLQKEGFLYNVFAYPNGNNNKATEEILMANGITMAFLFDHKINKEKIHPMNISRIRVSDTQTDHEFILRASGLHSFIFHLTR